MLRRNPLETAGDPTMERPEPEQNPASGIERRRHPRVSMDAEPDTNDAPAGAERRRHPRVTMTEEDPVIIRTSTYTGPDRRMADRRGLNGVQADVPWTVAKGTPRRSATLLGLPANRALLLLVAILAGGAAAYMVAGREPDLPPAPVAEPVAAPETPQVRVLVATDRIAVGQRVTGSLVSWQPWPQDGVREDFITEQMNPDAEAELAGQLARTAILPGEPIRAEKLLEGSSSFLALMLKPGNRAVAVSVSPASASGGFISADDRVDVLLTRPWGNTQVAETILRNVRVLAIDGKFGDAPEGPVPDGPVKPGNAAFSSGVIATLELDPMAAEVLTRAEASGQLTLALRAATDTASGTDTRAEAINAAIRLSSPFWAPPPPQSPAR